MITINVININFKNIVSQASSVYMFRTKLSINVLPQLA